MRLLSGLLSEEFPDVDKDKPLQEFWCAVDDNDSMDLTGVRHTILLIDLLTACNYDKDIPKLSRYLNHIKDMVNVFIYDYQFEKYDDISKERVSIGDEVLI